MPAGFPSGTARTTLFSSRLKRESDATKSRPSVFTSGLAASSWFICFCPAEMKMSHAAPSSIWVLRVPEESKLNTRVTLGWSSR